MGSIQRVGHIALGLLLLVCSVLVLADPDAGLKVAAAVLGVSLVIYGIRKILYYVTMARHMVGGYSLLFVGVIAIDVGAFVLTLLDQPRVAVVLYLVLSNGFTGLVGILRSMEGRRLGSKWIPSLLNGMVGLLIAIACIVFFGSDDTIALIFCVGLLYSAFRHIGWAFRRTDVAFIQ